MAPGTFVSFFYEMNNINDIIIPYAYKVPFIGGFMLNKRLVKALAILLTAVMIPLSSLLPAPAVRADDAIDSAAIIADALALNIAVTCFVAAQTPVLEPTGFG